MRFIPTQLHGSADYLVGLIVLALPFACGWTGWARFALIALALFAFIYSLCTDYELGIVRILSMRTHLLLDFVFGLAMLALPWVFDLSNLVAVIGGLAIVLVFTTKVTASDSPSC